MVNANLFGRRSSRAPGGISIDSPSRKTGSGVLGSARASRRESWAGIDVGEVKEAEGLLAGPPRHAGDERRRIGDILRGVPPQQGFLIRLEEIRIASGQPTRTNVTYPPSTRVQRAVT